jgi:bilirubin oxidase
MTMKTSTSAGTFVHRRSFVKLLSGSLLGTAGIVASCGGAGSGTTATAIDTTPTSDSNPLWIPPLLSGQVNGDVTSYELELAASSVQFNTGARTATYGYNGNAFWGPTLLMKKGTQARMQVKNSLPEDTTTHWHGMLVPGPVDGGPHQIVAAGTTWLTDPFTVKNSAATYWYHPHMHEMTQKQLTLGAGGFIIVQDDAESALNLPRSYGIDDIPLVLTSRRFTTINGQANQFQYALTAYGDYVLTNGVMNAHITLPQQLVRLRILNGEIERDYNLGLGDGRTFYVIGNDGGLLGSPVPVTRLVMAPGERYEILVNLSGDAVGSVIELKSFNGPDAGLSFGFAGLENASGGEFGSLLNYKTFNLLGIQVSAATAGALTTVPSTLVSSTFPSVTDLSQSRSLVITATGPGAPFTFNNVGFNMNTINQTVALGATESWTVNGGNIFGHSFHIHGVQFKLIARNGNSLAVKDYEVGWKDTFYVPINETVTFIAKFDDAADATYPYMYHCHMVNHEDAGLMGQFVVQ